MVTQIRGIITEAQDKNLVGKPFMTKESKISTQKGSTKVTVCTI